MLNNKMVKVGAFVLSSIGSSVQAGEWSTEIDFEMRHFLNKSQTVQELSNATTIKQQEQIASTGLASQDQPSIAIQPSYFNEWDGQKNSFSFKPFYRWDDRDDYRTHFDIREMVWRSSQGGVEHPWDLRVGVDKVFWGVAESHHLIDIVNQTDGVEDPKMEQKLGQPMLRATVSRDWGTLDMFVLPYFRGRTFAGPEGRLRSPTSLVRSPVVYESGLGQSHVDYAVRWSKGFDRLDVGLSYFRGTSRDPRIAQLDSLITPENPLGLQVNYDLISQIGLDVNYLLGDWILKLEAIDRHSNFERFYAFVTGTEYTFNGIYGSQMDMGTFLEYNFDSRGQGSAGVLQDDLFIGLRLAMNDEKSTEIKLGVMTDLNDASRTTRVELNRRLDDKWSIKFLGQGYHRIDSGNPLYAFKEDSFIQSTLVRYF
ncbi:hypothetical protein [Sulfuriferula thiophila]|uniref:hypothetical protein n=1 Tax=Sulfuriferula thiophila TaxID=1781211 RepID=UPI000F614889|nr:hypothetical protein [Sulfuriferula thiophila]